ncbi:cytochrome P450 [Streptomyces canus]|uniref:Cytochrome P450 n=1 Tax=Streptomyces canus TaxID=58343 RepID=A0AAW8FTM4_9ACTN|nr:cytochrome P450 [Streptomyces canus]MDQ0758972.1 cytochrome P450 [Streptomyces canus]MDQ0912412.1 cytochrome P450 [Streptomyces canus]
MNASVHELTTFPAVRSAAQPFAVPDTYRRLFGERRLPRVRLPAGRTAHLAGRYEDVRAVLAGPFSADGSHPGFPTARAGSGSSSQQLSFFRMDGADHRRYRRLTTAHFAVARLERLRPVVRGTVEELVAALKREGPGTDLVSAFAMPLPSLVICHILGVPYGDRERFGVLIDVMVRAPQMSREAVVDAVTQLQEYVLRLADAKRRDPSDDLLSDLVASFDADSSLDPRQLPAMVLLLLVAGHETTASMISLGALALMRDDAAREQLTADPALVTGAVEELLRYLAIAQWIPRVATEDTEIGGSPVRVGEGVVVLPMVANRDPAVFAEPDRLDPRRPNASAHVACGFGPHQCLGLQLARMELQEVFAVLFRELVGARPAVPAEQLPFRQRSAFFGLDALPVTW